MTHVAILGAGISGLTAANRLRDYAEVTIFEKSRGVGGRMAVRRDGPFVFDHGAQFFTAKTPEFIDLIQSLVSRNVVARWDARFVEIDHSKIIAKRQWDEEYPHYVATPGMNAIAKALCQSLTVELNTEVTKLNLLGDKWHLFDKEGTALGEFDWVLMTMPPKQIENVIPDYVGFYPQVESITMQGCYSLMLGFDSPLPLDFDAALVKDRDISWISVNSCKPGRDSPFCLLVHSTNQWADNHIDEHEDKVKQYLCEQVSSVLGHSVTQASHIDIHRWYYANAVKQSGPNFFIDEKHKMGACGDWCIQGRVEAAFMSGCELAAKVIGALNADRMV